MGPEPEAVVGEFRRVLRPGGTALVTLPFGYGYELQSPEARYTEHELRALFARGWDNVDVTENGGRTVTWTVLSASLVAGLEFRVASRSTRRPLRVPFACSYVLLNALGLALSRLETRLGAGRAVFPMNLMLTARRPLRE